MIDETRSWPIGLQRLAEVVGPAAAVRLAEAFGGTEDNYIPKKATVDHPFTVVIGLDRMEALCAVFGTQRIEIPRGTHRDMKKVAIHNASGTRKQIALQVGCSQRYVRKVLNAADEDNQPGLFDSPT